MREGAFFERTASDDEADSQGRTVWRPAATVLGVLFIDGCATCRHPILIQVYAY